MYLKDKTDASAPGWPIRKLSGTLLGGEWAMGRLYRPFFSWLEDLSSGGTDGVSGSVPGAGHLEGLVAG